MRQMRDAISPDSAKLLTQSTIQGRIERLEARLLKKWRCVRADGKWWTKWHDQIK